MKMYKGNKVVFDAYEIGDNHAVSERELTEQDKTILNIIRIGANRTNVTAACDARKKSIAFLRKNGKSRTESEIYVDALILDHYPDEFKKAESGKKYKKYSTLNIALITVFAFLLVVLFNDLDDNYIEIMLFVLLCLLACMTFNLIKMNSIKKTFKTF